MRTRRLALAVVLLAAPLLHAEEEQQPLRAGFQELVAVKSLSSEENGNAYAILGRLSFEQEGVFSVRAHRFVLWLDPRFEKNILRLLDERRKDKSKPLPTWGLRAVYAEGGTRAPAVFQVAGRIFRCASFYYDFRKAKGLFVDTQVRMAWAESGEEEFPFVMRAKAFQALPGELRASNATLFTSPYQKAEVEVRVRKITIRNTALKKALGEFLRVSAHPDQPGAAQDQEALTAAIEEVQRAATEGETRAKIEKGAVHLFGRRLTPRRNATWSSASEFPWIIQANVGGHGQLNTEYRVGVGRRHSLGGDDFFQWILGGGYFQHRGPFADLTLDLKALDGKVTGHSFGVGLFGDDGSDFGVEPETRDRYWTNNKYRWQISKAWRLDAELDLLSDPTWLRSYDENEFKTGKVQETYAYFRRRGDRTYVTFIVKPRLIDFQTVVEELPSLAASIPAHTLYRSGNFAVQVAMNPQVANLHSRPGDLDPRGDFRTARFDIDPTIHLSFPVGVFRVVPFATFRLTGYEDTPSNGSLLRYVGSAGMRVDTQAHKWFGKERHLVNLSVQYIDTYEVSEPASDIFAMDAIDRIAPFQELQTRLRGRWQKPLPNGAMRTWLDVELLGLWYPEGKRPLGLRGDGYIELDAVWSPGPRLAVFVRGSYGADSGDLETGAVEGNWLLRPTVALGLSMRHLDGDSDVGTFTTDFDVGSRWRITGRFQYDFRNSERLDQSLVVSRLGHTLAYTVRLGFDPGNDGFSAGFAIDLARALRKRQPIPDPLDQAAWNRDPLVGTGRYR